MKKFLTLAAVAVFVFTLAAATYAVDFKASGLIRVRTACYVNSDGAPRGGAVNFDDTEAWMDQRFRLQMKLQASEDLYGVVYFEGDSSKWGEAGVARNTAGAWGAGGSDRNAVELKQFYIDFKIPVISDFAPTRLRAGTQWLAIRSHVWLGADGAGLRFFTEAGPVRLYLNWFKPGEGTDWHADDTDLYAVRAVLALPDFPVQPGMFVAYWNANDYPLLSGLQTQHADFYWIGVNVDGKIGPANLKTDFVYVNGEVERTAAALQDQDYGGWLFYADANLPVAMLTVGGTFMYATGNDIRDTTKATGTQDFGGYVIPPGSEANPALGIVFWTSTVNDGVDICGGSNGARTGGNTAVQPRWFGGLWTVKGYASFKPLDWLKVTGYGMYIGDTVKNGDAIGDSRKAPFGAANLDDNSYIGIEVGAITDIKIYKELTYSIGAGYLFAGDAMDTWDGVASNKSPDDPWAIVSQLIYKF